MGVDSPVVSVNIFVAISCFLGPTKKQKQQNKKIIITNGYTTKTQHDNLYTRSLTIFLNVCMPNFLNFLLKF